METNFSNPPDETQIRLFLVRHGETDANLRKILQGPSDGPLNETGKRQAQRLGKHLSCVHLDKIYSSDLQRAASTARAVAATHDLEPSLDPRLREWDCGEWDAMPAKDFIAMMKEKNLSVSALEPPHGETLGGVRNRAEDIISEIVLTANGKSILIASHGDMMRVILSVLLNIEIDKATAFQFDNASYSILEYVDGTWRVITLNRIADKTN